MTNARNRYMKNYRTRRKEMGLCRTCDNPICERSTCMCVDCLDSNNKLSRKSFKKMDPLKKRHVRLKSSASSRGIECLSFDQFSKWEESQDKKCAYCSIGENMLRKSKRRRVLTIDRRDNSKGYISDNMCYCCNRCNILKSDFFTEGQWMEISDKYIKPRLDEYHGFES